MNTKYIIKTQYKEWYGDEDHVGEEGYGRHKNKGGHNIIIEVDEYPYLDESRVIADFNKEYDRTDRFTRFQALSVEHYEAPVVGEFKDGKVTFGF